ncbi:MAG: DUF2442 domain-containing protein [SAR324 cluster bacterium]|nr:DUF2442 domain-containing protein [SAR324 cluster bacterium]
MLHVIKKIKQVTPFSLILLFNTGETVQVDLGNKLKEWSQSPKSKFKALLDPAYFQSVKLDNDAQTICWDNGIDLCPDVLYSMGKVITVSNKVSQKIAKESIVIG